MKKLFLSMLMINATVQAVELTYDKKFSNPKTYTLQAARWAADIIKHCSSDEVERIANLLVFAYLRSKSTLEAQEMLTRYESMIAENITVFDATRLNPGRYVKQHATYQELGTLTASVQQALLNHQENGMRYTHALDSLIKHRPIVKPEAQEIFALMRNDVRISALTALGSITENFSAALREAKAVLAEALSILHGDTRGFMQNTLESIGALFIQTCAKSDMTFSKTQAKTHKALVLARCVHDATWKVMEETRIAFYQAYYIALYPLIPAPHIRFTITGELPKGRELLPSPTSLFSLDPVS